MTNKAQPITHGIVHAGFRGLRAFVAHKIVWCIQIGNRFVVPHDTIPSNVGNKARKRHIETSQKIHNFVKKNE